MCVLETFKICCNLLNSLEEKLSEENNFGKLRKVVKKLVANREPVVPWFELVNKLRNWAHQYEDYVPTSLPGTASSVSPLQQPQQSLQQQSQSLQSSSTTPSDLPSPSSNSPLLNFAKMYILGDQMLTFQNYKLNIEQVELFPIYESQTEQMIRSYLEHLPVFSDEVLWKLSLQCEPIE